MKRMSCLVISVLFALSFPVFAQEETVEQAPPTEYSQGYIADELIIYMHAGAGNNFRILGSVTAGSQINLTGKQENGYTQILDTRNRVAWVESKFISQKPGLRFVIAELNEQLTSAADENNQLKLQLDQSQKSIEDLASKNNLINEETTILQQQLTEVQGKLKSQDMDIKKEWFFNGAFVLCFGLLMGLIVPKLFGGRSSKMDRWT